MYVFNLYLHIIRYDSNLKPKRAYLKIFLLKFFKFFNFKGRKPISKDIILSLNEHLQNNSNVASNRVICTNPKQTESNTVSVRYLNSSLKESYRCFDGKNSLCFSSYCKYIEKIYKKPHRLTDICRYCEYGLQLKRDIIKHAKEYNYTQQIYSDKDDKKYDLNTADLLDFFKNKKTQESNLTISRLNELIAIQFHRKIAKVQREAYNKMRINEKLLENALLIDIDFKQKIVIGSSPRQISSEYFKNIQKSLLGNVSSNFV